MTVTPRGQLAPTPTAQRISVAPPNDFAKVTNGSIVPPLASDWLRIPARSFAYMNRLPVQNTWSIGRFVEMNSLKVSIGPPPVGAAVATAAPEARHSATTSVAQRDTIE